MTKSTTKAETIAADRFTDTVTSVAFHLTLSKNMIAALGWLHGGKQTETVGMCQMGALSALENRGLVNWVRIDDGSRSRCELTRAGRLTCELLIIAGLIPRVPAGKPRKAAKRG